MPFSGWSSSGVVAFAVPIRPSPAGQASAANWTRVQTVPMWALSSSSPFGSATEMRADVRFARLRPSDDRVERRVAAPLDAAASSFRLSFGS